MKLMRIKHWIKNILIFFPLVFSGNLLVKEKCVKTILGFVLFCLVSSAIYIVNDLRDIDSDRMHETKKNRPLASGAVSKIQAIVLVVLLLGCSTGMVSLLGGEGGGICSFISAHQFSVQLRNEKYTDSGCCDIGGGLYNKITVRRGSCQNGSIGLDAAYRNDGVFLFGLW